MRRQVKKLGQPGSELYYFPKQSVGQGQEWKATGRMERVQDRTAGDFADYAASIDNLMGTAAGSLTDPAASSSDAHPIDVEPWLKSTAADLWRS